MRHVFALAALSGLMVMHSSSAQSVPSQANLGKRIANVTFTDATGKKISLHDCKGDKGLVVVFLSFECPVSNSYTQPLADMAKEYTKHGIGFLGLTINSDDTDAEVAKHAKEYNLPFPVVCDRKLEAAEALKADITPECFFLDSDGYLRYRGRIDNAYSERLKKHPQVTEHNLRQVIGEVLSGRPISVPATAAVGCTIPRNQKDAVQTTTHFTYYRDVLPILQNHCQTCHRAGEVGPFSLMTYKQAVSWADDIKTYTQKRVMPPWKPVAGATFHNERRLSDKDIATLAAWVDGGTPAGDLKDAPAGRKFSAGWQLGTPDLVLSVPEEFMLGPTGSDVFRCFVLPTNLKEDRYVAAVEVRPGNPRVVHHTLQFIDTTGQGRKLERREKEKKRPEDPNHPSNQYDKGPGYNVAMGVGFLPQGGLGGWAPGNQPRELPEGYGYFLPKGSDVVVQVHYHRNGRIERDKTQLGLYFAKDNTLQPYQGAVMAGTDERLLKLPRPLQLAFSIPAGAERHHLQGDLWATGDFNLYSVMPHMHMIGKEIHVTLTPPDGKPQTLIHIMEWDYNWQETYFLKQPLPVKKGTRLHVDAYYDNSAKNPSNPFNPPRRITYGEQTTNEMCFVFLGGTGGVGGRNPRALPLTSVAPSSRDSKAPAAK